MTTTATRLRPVRAEMFLDVLGEYVERAAQLGVARLPDDAAKTRQEDAHEFLVFLLDALDDEFAALRAKIEADSDDDDDDDDSGDDDGDDNDDDDGWAEVGKNNRKSTLAVVGSKRRGTMVEQTFRGMMRSEVRRYGSAPSVTMQPFVAVQLELNAHPGVVHRRSRGPMTLLDALHDHVSAEIIEEGLTKQALFDTLPRCLIFHIKRFTFSAEGGLTKITRPVTFPLTVDLPDEVMSPGQRGLAQPEDRRYTLAAVIEHHGERANSGHYTAIVALGDDSWALLDDGAVIPVSEDRVLASQPYLLFYMHREALAGDAE
jgi:ubiquitin carboxyl-terminal hydrolase 10